VETNDFTVSTIEIKLSDFWPVDVCHAIRSILIESNKRPKEQLKKKSVVVAVDLAAAVWFWLLVTISSFQH
jgi:hypothetical protein